MQLNKQAGAPAQVGLPQSGTCHASACIRHRAMCCPIPFPWPQNRKLWSLKEAFVKATGEGLGFELGLIEFQLAGSTGRCRVGACRRT